MVVWAARHVSTDAAIEVQLTVPNLAKVSGLFVTFGDSGSWKQNCHERGESDELGFQA
jgi:hypothetical protein